MRLFFRLYLASFLLGILISDRANAVAPVLDVDIFYFSDGFIYSSTTKTYTRTFWDVMLGIPVAAKKRFILGWNYDSYGLVDNPGGSPTTLTITDMGPKLMYYLNKDQSWVIAFTYGLINKGSYSSGGAATVLQGSSMRGELGYVPQISESFSVGAKLNYYKATFTEQIANQTTITKVTDSRTLIYPSLVMTLKFD